MRTVTATISIRSTLAEVWDLYFDRARWSGWVDGFKSVERAADGYPGSGSTLVWRSGPAGRGRVQERVMVHEPRRLHRIAYADEHSSGELETRFEIEGEAVRLTQELSYSLEDPGVLGITDLLFVRREQRRSLERSLLRFRHEAEYEALPAIDRVAAEDTSGGSCRSDALR